MRGKYTDYGSEMKAYKISTRQAHTRVRLQQGEVLVIGGLMDNRVPTANTKGTHIRRYSVIGQIISS